MGDALKNNAYKCVTLLRDKIYKWVTFVGVKSFTSLSTCDASRCEAYKCLSLLRVKPRIV